MAFRDRLAAALATSESNSASSALADSDDADDADNDPSPQTRQPSGSGIWSWSSGDRPEWNEVEPPSDDYLQYRNLYYTFDIIGAGLDILASEVSRPGFYIDVSINTSADAEGVDIDADDAEAATKQALEAWADECAIHAGETGQSFQPLLRQIARDFYRDGDAPLELAWDDPEEGNRLLGLKPIDPATLSYVTYQGSSMLVRPDDDDPPNKTPTNARGENAAYVQYPDIDSSVFYDPNEEEEIYLSQTDVVRIPRNPGFDGRSPTGSGASSAAAVGSYLSQSETPATSTIRGVSIIERVTTEAERLRARLQDYNASIAAMAYPRLRAEFEDYTIPGTEERPSGPETVHWDAESIDDFLESFERDTDPGFDPTDEPHYAGTSYLADESTVGAGAASNSTDKGSGAWTDPGGKIGTPPGVTTELIQSEAPDISHSVTLSINKICGGLGVPKFMLGFGEDLNRRISEEQQARFEQDVRSTRRYIERRLSPIFQLKAEELANRDDSDIPSGDGVDIDVRLRIGSSKRENAVHDEDFDADKFQKITNGLATYYESGLASEIPLGKFIENTLNMNPDDLLDADDSTPTTPDTDTGTDTPSAAEASGGTDSAIESGLADALQQASDTADEPTADDTNDDDDGDHGHEHDHDHHEAALADPRLISTEDEYTALRQFLAEVFIDARDTALDELATTANNSAVLAADRRTDRGIQTVMRAITQAIRRFLGGRDIDSRVREIHSAVYEKTIDKLTSATHTPSIEQGSYAVTVGATPDRAALDFYVANTGNQIDDISDELTSKIRTQLRRGLEADQSIDEIHESIEADLSDSYLQDRAGLIARQETQFVAQGIRYRAYENDANVAGVQVINPCTSATTRLCEHLAGCGARDSATATFDHPDDLSVGEQLQEQAPAGSIAAQFDPLPNHPPFHFNCRSELIPDLDGDIS